MRFICSYQNCGKEYSNAFNLKRHVESFHLSVKKFFCSICGKGLSTKQNMREHSFIHQDVKPYVCYVDECLKEFRQLSQLKIHLKMHYEVERIVKQEIHDKAKMDLSVFRQGLKDFCVENHEIGEKKETEEVEENFKKKFDLSSMFELNN